MNNGFWDKIEGKTNVSKNQIIELANKLKDGHMKDKDTLEEVIDTLASLTGKKVSSEKKQKIIDKIVNDKVPKNIDKMF